MPTTPPPKSPTDPLSSSPPPFDTPNGQVVDLLIKNEIITADQLRYARRVAAKLETPKTILNILKELEYLTEDQIFDILRRHRIAMHIGELLVELGYIDALDLQTVLRMKTDEHPDKKIGELLIEKNFIKEQDLIQVLSIHLGYTHLEPDFNEIDKSLYTKASVKWYEQNEAIPICKDNDEVLITFFDPTDSQTIKEAKHVFGPHIALGIARKSYFRKFLNWYKSQSAKDASVVVDESSVVNITEAILQAAVDAKASDIHIEPLSDIVRVRFRQDGVLNEFKKYPLEILPPLSSRIKVLCSLNITEKRRHQGGRFFYEFAGEQLDLRVSFYITVHGEKIVIRLLNRQGVLIELSEIGISPKTLHKFTEDALELPSGVILVTGPTGSGKTSTVYSCINYLNNPQTSIVTAEEPVEYVIDGVAQCSINPAINLTFQETLRHIVRQDPDVILIGEIRDNFSAEVAVQAALTGHKVLTTFHTEDSIGGLVRLLNMGVEAFLISSTVVSVMAQRLVRRICPDCAKPYKPEMAKIQRLGYKNLQQLQGATFQIGEGCASCRYTGYKGRLGVFELLVLDELVRNAIIERRTSYEIRKISMESTGLVTLLEHGIVKAAAGKTTVDELLRCIPRLHPPRPLAELHRLLGE